jgi:hypothetical protein
VTFEEFVATALALPNTTLGTRYGQPAVFREEKLMLALREDEVSVVIKTGWDSRYEVFSEQHESVFSNAHYDGWPGFLVRLDLVEADLAERFVEMSWKDAPNEVGPPPTNFDSFAQE